MIGFNSQLSRYFFLFFGANAQEIALFSTRNYQKDFTHAAQEPSEKPPHVKVSYKSPECYATLGFPIDPKFTNVLGISTSTLSGVLKLP